MSNIGVRSSSPSMHYLFIGTSCPITASGRPSFATPQAVARAGASTTPTGNVDMYGLLLLLHLLAATIWTGGHIVLSIVVLPRALRERSPEQLLQFESGYEKIGMPALIIQIITGLILAYRMLPDFGQWLNFSNPITHVLAMKFILLVLTIGFAVDAKFRVIPHLSDKNLVTMAWHIVPVTIFSVLFVVAGVSFRTGWVY